MTGVTPDPMEANFGSIPLIVGVTGHRDLRIEDAPALEEKVRAIFHQLRTALPNTPVVLLTPLAEGADRLVARVALEMDARLQVSLPMPRALYETDFATANSRAEFEELSAQAAYTVEMPLAAGEAEVRQPGQARNRQYDAVGEFIARHSQILIALWDGVPSDKTGGTADIVRWRLHELPQETASRLYPPDPVRSGPVYHVVTPRQSGAAPSDAFQVRRLLPECGPDEPRKPDVGSNDWERVKGEAKELYGGIDGFNKEASGLDSEGREAVALSRCYLFPDDQAARLSAGLRFTRECFALADVLAVRFGHKTLWSHRLIYLFVFLAVVTYEVCGHLLGMQALGLLLYPLILGVAGAIYFRAVRINDFQNNYHDYRALAEGLRVQFFWRLGGLNESVEEHYLRRQRRELHWVRRGLRIAWAVQGGGIPAADELLTPQAQDLLVSHWVDDQHAFFKRKANEEEKVERLYKLAIWGLLVVGLSLSLVIGLVLLNPKMFGGEVEHWVESDKHWEGILLFSTSLPMLTAALLHAYRKAIALGSHVKQYHVMVRLFENAQNRVKALADRRRLAEEHSAELKALVIELGNGAPVENGDWIVLNRDRPLEVPTGAELVPADRSLIACQIARRRSRVATGDGRC